jgi:hypothetical protein
MFRAVENYMPEESTKKDYHCKHAAFIRLVHVCNMNKKENISRKERKRNIKEWKKWIFEKERNKINRRNKEEQKNKNEIKKSDCKWRKNV